MNKITVLTLGSLLALGTAGCAENPRPYVAPVYAAPAPAYAAPAPAYAAPGYAPGPRAGFFDRGFQQGYRAGFELRGGSGAPGHMTDGLYRVDRDAFRNGYRDGFNKGKFDRRHGLPPTYPLR